MASLQGSPVPAGPVEGGLISVQFFGNPSPSIPNQPDSRSPGFVTIAVATKFYCICILLLVFKVVKN